MGFLDWLRRKPALTPLQYLAAAQKKFPPIPAPGSQQDYGQRLYSGLEGRLPSTVRELFSTGTVVIGELGILTPDAFTDFVLPAGYAVQIHTGLPRFLYRVSRAMHTRINVFGPSGNKVQATTTTVEETVAILSEVFRNFIRDGSVRGPSDYEISSEQIGIASALATQAETFVVAHEIGHVVLWLQQGGALKPLSPQAEFEADRLAVEIILGWHEGDPTAIQFRRMEYAGAEFALRVFAGLDHLGFKFKESHPPPDERLEYIRQVATALCGDCRGFMRVSTIAFSYDQLLEDVERELTGSQAAARFVLGLTPERVLSSLSVLIEECVKGVITENFVGSEASKILVKVPEAVMRQTAKKAALMYKVDPVEQRKRDPNSAAMAHLEDRMFKKLTQLLPQSARNIFDEAVATLR